MLAERAAGDRARVVLHLDEAVAVVVDELPLVAVRVGPLDDVTFLVVGVGVRAVVGDPIAGDDGLGFAILLGAVAGQVASPTLRPG